VRLDLVALGHRDAAHVVADPRDRQPGGLVPAAGRPRPVPDPRERGRVGPVADNGLARQPHARLEERELAVAVRGLVGVHVVHVDLRPRQCAIELRVQVQQRLGEDAQAGDPHLGRREGMHPEDQADAVVGGVRLQAEAADRLGRRRRLAQHDAHRHGVRPLQRGRDLARVGRDRGEHLLAIHLLTAGDEPKLVAAQRLGAHARTSCSALAATSR
jgi:hypothetical protein